MANLKILRYTFFIIIGSCVNPLLIAQEIPSEKRYYQSFPEHLTGRFYFSRKYTAIKIKDLAGAQVYQYRPNTTLNMGVGATYKDLTLNLAYGFGFLNPEQGKGDTKYLDAQAHIYPKKLVIDVFLQFYKGYYLIPVGWGAQDEASYYSNPDMRVHKLGTSVQYVFNNGKFSYRAAFLQNEWQKKSAGTFLLGFEVFGGMVDGNSGLIPHHLMENPERNFRTVRFLDFGPNIGYAYSWIIQEHFFITGSAASNLGAGYSNLQSDSGKNIQWGIRPNYLLRGSIGYNSAKWAVNVNYVHNNVRLIENQGFSNEAMTGNYRFNFIYRFLPGPKLSPYLKYVERVKKVFP